MPHDKIRAAALKRMAKTGEPYAAARCAVIAEHQAGGARTPSASGGAGAGYALRMSGEMHELQDLHRRLLDAGRTQEAAQAAGMLAAARQQAAEVRRLLPGVADARQRLDEEGRRLQARAGAFRARRKS